MYERDTVLPPLTDHLTTVAIHTIKTLKVPRSRVLKVPRSRVWCEWSPASYLLDRVWNGCGLGWLSDHLATVAIPTIKHARVGIEGVV